MKRIIVIGSPGAGKSTFARQLRDITGLPLYYLDMIWHLPDRTTITKDEFDQKLKSLMRNFGSGSSISLKQNYPRYMDYWNSMAQEKKSIFSEQEKMRMSIWRVYRWQKQKNFTRRYRFSYAIICSNSNYT